jgi:hypothetical protein
LHSKTESALTENNLLRVPAPDWGQHIDGRKQAWMAIECPP